MSDRSLRHYVRLLLLGVTLGLLLYVGYLAAGMF